MITITRQDVPIMGLCRIAFLIFPISSGQVLVCKPSLTDGQSENPAGVLHPGCITPTL
jgi:hypothetical protein